MEKVREFSQEELEEVYAMWFRGYDNVSTLLDKREIDAAKHLLDEMDKHFYEFFRPE